MAATLTACHAVFHPGRDGGASGRGEPASGFGAAQARGGEASRARLHGWAPCTRPAAASLVSRSSRNKATHAPAVEVCLEDPSPAVLLLVAGTAFATSSSDTSHLPHELVK